MQTHDKLFTPGPVEVSPKTWAAFSRPMIGHRGEDFKNLYRAIYPKLQILFGTKQPVFLSTSSAWGVMEASIRNLVDRGVLCCMCGAFSDKWFDVAKRCGKNAEPLKVDWGKHIDHKIVDRQLATGKFDTVTLIHNETSTGVMNPLGEICGILAKYPDVALVVDTVSSFSGVKIDMDAFGIDVMLTGAQKALALPPGFSLFSVSEKVFARAEKVPNRGFYFDFLEFRKQQAQWMTPSTPSIAHIHALQSKLDEILEEGLAARFESARAHECACARLGSTGWIRFLCRGRIPIKDAHLRKEQSRYRRAKTRARFAVQTSSGHRPRLRQDPGQNLSPLQYGRRNRRKPSRICSRVLTTSYSGGL